MNFKTQYVLLHDVVAPQDRLRRAAFFFGLFSFKGFKGLRFFGGGAFAFVGLVGRSLKKASDKGKKTFLACAISSCVTPGNLLTCSISFFTNQLTTQAVHFLVAY
jgi:hypothetical protein